MQDTQNHEIRLIPISDITFTPNTWTEKHDQILESLTDLGFMINPVTVRASNPHMDHWDLTLEAGDKRLQAAQRLGWLHVPALVLRPDQASDVLMHENLMRHQMPWPQEVAMVADYHAKKQQIHGAASRGRARIVDGEKIKKVGWSIADTAATLGASVGKIHGDIALANALITNKHLAGITDKRTALRLLKEATERVEREALALMPQSMTDNDFQYDQVIHGSSADVLSLFPPEVFNAVITDPPWTQYKDVNLTADRDTVPVFEQVYRVLKPGGFFYCIVSTTDFQTWVPLLKNIGFEVQSYPLIWQKSRTLTRGLKPWCYSRDYEPIIVAVKGRAMLCNAKERSSIFNYPNVPHQHMIHPHEKPVELIREIISNCTFPGEAILDPFAGSGVVPFVARELGRKYVAIERDPHFYNGIVSRLAGEKVAYTASPIAPRVVD